MVHSSLRKLYRKLLKEHYKVLTYRLIDQTLCLLIQGPNPWDKPEELKMYKNISVTRSGLFYSDKKSLFMAPHKKDPNRGWK